MFWGESSINMKPLQWCPRTVCGLNLAKPNQIVAALERLAPDLIVNPAAYTAVDRAEAERELTFLANAKAPAVIAHYAARRKVPLVHFSTDYVFKGQETPPGPRSARRGHSQFPDGVSTTIREIGGPHLITRVSWIYATSGANFPRTTGGLLASLPN
jgi:dTDP-4-dehydrorhamnose reductase